jgi:hypothetical protein
MVWNNGQSFLWSAFRWENLIASSYRYFLKNELWLHLENVPSQTRWIWDSRFSWQWIWRLWCSGMWRYAVWYTGTDTVEEYAASSFKVNTEDQRSMFLQILVPIYLWQGVTSQKTVIFKQENVDTTGWRTYTSWQRYSRVPEEGG